MNATTAREKKEAREKRKDMRDTLSLLVSAAGLGVSIAAMCLNTKQQPNDLNKGERDMLRVQDTVSRMNGSARDYPGERQYSVGTMTAEEKMAEAKARTQAADKEKKAEKMLTKANKQTAKIKKTEQKRLIRETVSDVGYTGKVILLNTKSGKTEQYRLVPVKNGSKTAKAWVAMEMNTSTGGNRQAVVCASKEEAVRKAEGMKRAHREDPNKARFSQGYAYVDTAKPIDVAKCFRGGCNLYRV